MFSEYIPESKRHLKARTHCDCGGPVRVPGASHCLECSQVVCRERGSQRIMFDRSGPYSVAIGRPPGANPEDRCPSCDDTFSIAYTDGPYQYVKECANKGLAANITLYNRARIPALFFDSTFVNYETKSGGSREAKGFVEQWTKAVQGDGIHLVGPKGSGKTHLMCAAIRTLTIKHGKSCLYADWSDLVDSFGPAYKEGASKDDVVSRYIAPDVLFIDEIGALQDRKPWALDVLQSIVDRRYRHGNKVLCIATNYSNGQLERWLGERGPAILSRLTELCGQLVIDAPDYRQQEIG